MIRMLDSNICIYIITQAPKHVGEKFERYQPGDIGISSIVLSELVFGAYNSERLKKNLTMLEEFTRPIEILTYGRDAAYEYGKLRADLKKKGALIGQLDIQIAAHALSENAILVTNNMKEFSRINELRCENWV